MAKFWLAIGFTALMVLGACGGGENEPLVSNSESHAKATIAAATDIAAAMDTKIRLPASSVIASSNDGNVPSNTVDNNLTTTRWAANGDGQWIQYDLGISQTIGSIKIAWYAGTTRKATFDLLISIDGTRWTTLLASQQSSGATAGLETYDIADTAGRYVRIVGHGNTLSMWNSILETEIWRSTSALATKISLPISAAKSSNNDGNVPGNTLDGNLTGSRWAANGEGQWILYDLGDTKTVAFVKMAWNKGGERKAKFDVQISADNVTWVALLTSQQSSGITEALETFDFADTPGRYVRIVGHGNTVNAWNSIWETELYEASGAATSYAVTTTVSGSGSVSTSPNQPHYAANSTVGLTAIPAANYTFTGWSGDATGTTNPLAVVVNGDKNITATFNPVVVGSYLFDVATSGSGSVVKAPNATSYAAGTIVSLTATPAAGFIFAGWSGSVTGTTNLISVTMNANKTAVATFVPTGCVQTPSLIKTTFEVEGDPSPYSADGCSMVFEPLVAQFTTSNGHGWRHEVKIPKANRLGMTKTTESLRAEVKVDLSKGSKTIITQYHAEGTGTIMKVYISDTDESSFLNSIANDGIFDVYVRMLPAGSSSEVKLALGTIKTGESFNLAVTNALGKVTVSAFGKSLTTSVDDGGASYLKFGNYLQSQNPVGTDDCSPFATCYAKFGITVSKITMTNINYSRSE